MSDNNIFADDWRDCLRAHYSHVVRTEDHVTEPSLHKVMNAAGFSESELAEMRVRATMRADEMPDGFEPDLDILAEAPPEVAEAPAEVSFMMAVPEIPAAEAEPTAILEETAADEAEPFSVEEEAPVDEAEPAPADEGTFYEADDDEDAPQQLSLF
jgi:hypothetical protein